MPEGEATAPSSRGLRNLMHLRAGTNCAELQEQEPARSPESSRARRRRCPYVSHLSTKGPFADASALRDMLCSARRPAASPTSTMSGPRMSCHGTHSTHGVPRCGLQSRHDEAVAHRICVGGAKGLTLPCVKETLYSSRCDGRNKR